MEEKLAEGWPVARWRDVHVVVGCSGGADSTALLRALLALLAGQGSSPKLIVAHFNHHWRGDASDHDQHFVEQLAARWHLACHVGHAAPETSHSGFLRHDEATARRARHQFLLETAIQTGARHVVLAHTADDQAETILHRIVRGTGVSGLAGMRRVRPLNADVSLVRPLLDCRRGDVLEYLHALGQDYRIDASNDDTRYTRNRIRHELMPRLRAQFNPNVVDALLQLGQLASDVSRDALRRIDRCLDAAMLDHTTAEVRLRRDIILEQLPPSDQPELFKAIWQRHHWPMQSMGYRQWCELANMLSGPDRTAMFPGAVRAELLKNILRLARITDRE